jgi:hypothetical protein
MSGDMTMRREKGDLNLGQVPYARGLFDGMRVMTWTTNEDGHSLARLLLFLWQYSNVTGLIASCDGFSLSMD